MSARGAFPGLLLALFAGCQAPPTSTPPTDPEPPAETTAADEPVGCAEGTMALIGSESLPMGPHDKLMALKGQKYVDRGRDMPKTAERRYRATIAERLILQHLLELEIANLGQDYDHAALDERIRQQRGSIRDWTGHLRRRGESEATLRKRYIALARENLLLDQRGGLEPTPEDIAAEFERLGAAGDSSVDRVHAWSVFVAVEPDRKGRTTLAEAVLDAESLALRAREADADLSSIALLAERERASRERDRRGYIGFVTAADMPQEWSQPVFAAQVGEVLVIPASTGVYIVKVLGHWGPGPIPLDDYEAEVTKRVTKQKREAAREALANELYERYAVTDCVALRLPPDPRRSPEP